MCPLGTPGHSDGLIRYKLKKNGPSLRKLPASNETADVLDFPFFTSCVRTGRPCVRDSGRDMWKG